ncbi:hypothetical protein CN326_23010 [Bacillus sp. AFS018417]|nr:hypothetical protein CN326_23010 [Bacillus sp. AFS018417]
MEVSLYKRIFNKKEVFIFHTYIRGLLIIITTYISIKFSYFYIVANFFKEWNAETKVYKIRNSFVRKMPSN